MHYTQSSNARTHLSGRRMHQEDEPVPTAVSASDLNSVMWSLMAVLEAGGVEPAVFDPDQPDTYNRLKLSIQALIANSGDPVGTVKVGYYTATAPVGYVPLSGQMLSRATDPALWLHAQQTGAVVSDTAWLAGEKGNFSSGDGSTTFRVPLLGGQHVRILDDGANVDTGRTLGSLQSDQLVSHTHGLELDLKREDGAGQVAGGGGVADGNWTGTTQSAGAGNEVRVKTVALRAIMKRW